MTKMSFFGGKENYSETDSSRNFYRVGAIAALIAAFIFRRNLGAEITLMTGQSSPSSAAGWFSLLQKSNLLGLAFLNVFDMADYVLVGVMFLALYVALRRTNKNFTATAVILNLVGIAIYLVSNTTFSMLSLSSQYAITATDAQRSTLLSAGQALLAEGAPGAVYQGIGGYISLFLLATAGLIISAIMLRSKIFNRITAYIGIVASAFDLAYIIGLAFVPTATVYLLSASCLSVAGLLLLVWHLLIGLKLYQLSRTSQVKGGGNL
jgi:hypothetical protein